MRVFVTGTDTNIGKTVICSWLCLHSGSDYFKPIQTGGCEETDSQTLFALTGNITHKENYLLQAPLSPHLAAKLENKTIDITQITLPSSKRLIVEGAGGLLVPIDENHLMIDLIQLLSIPVILVASARLGTINHTLLSLEALKSRGIETLGVIMNGVKNQDNCDAIEFYGATPILAQIPFLATVDKKSLEKIAFSKSLENLFGDEQ